MKSEWLIKEKRNKLILFFAGWGMDANPFRHMTSDDADVLMFFDYSDQKLSFDLSEVCSEYASVTLLAWSLGVPVASLVCREHALKPDCAVAVNGTECPVDDQYGLPVVLFDATLDSLSDENLIKFYRRMCRLPEVFDFFVENAPDRELGDIREELRILRELPSCEGTIFNRAMVSKGDRIVPSENQFRYWKMMEVPATEISGPHFPFHLISKWEDLINA